MALERAALGFPGHSSPAEDLGQRTKPLAVRRLILLSNTDTELEDALLWGEMVRLLQQHS